MRKNVKKQIMNISFVVILVAITMVALLNSNKELNFESLKDFFSKCNYWYIVGAFGFFLAFVLFEALSLHVILKRFGYKSKISSSIAYSASDIYYSAITPSASGGQPASAFYMIRDGVSGGTAGFSLIFNLVGYTAALLILGVAAFVVDFNMFFEFAPFVKVLIIFGFVAQVALLIFFILCMRKHRQVMAFSGFCVNFLHKLHLIKNKDKWLGKMGRLVVKYKSCYKDFKNNKITLFWVILLNVVQRLSLVMVSVMVCKSVVDCNAFEVFAMQAFVVLGYNSIPLPGGIGAYEYLYLSIYGLSFTGSFIVVAMMVTRVISYYLSMILCGIYTMVYHVIGGRNKKSDDEEVQKQLEEHVLLSKELEN